MVETGGPAMRKAHLLRRVAAVLLFLVATPLAIREGTRWRPRIPTISDR